MATPQLPLRRNNGRLTATQRYNAAARKFINRRLTELSKAMGTIRLEFDDASNHNIILEGYLEDISESLHKMQTLPKERILCTDCRQTTIYLIHKMDAIVADMRRHEYGRATEDAARAWLGHMNDVREEVEGCDSCKREEGPWEKAMRLQRLHSKVGELAEDMGNMVVGGSDELDRNAEGEEMEVDATHEAGTPES